ncbi:MAG: anhydro-N-acetylmuramic acid kinase [Cyanobacteria bacterium J06635_15]
MKVIGLISGTSVDGIDAALVEVTGTGYTVDVTLIHGATYAYAPALRQKILAIALGAPVTLTDLATLDDTIAQAFAQAALSIQADQAASDHARLIGSHGQTVFHRPTQPQTLGYSLQLGRGDAIARLTRTPTISNFRAADIALGGQGAPLVPLVDACLLSHASFNRCVQNLGGIGNATYLPAQTTGPEPAISQVRGWDTGPGNSLIDLAVAQLSGGQQHYDQNGAWAAKGIPCLPLVDHWLQHEYFQQIPPKSTGRELFGPDYLKVCLMQATAYDLNPADILATLTDFTAASIAQEYIRFLPQLPDQILLCGGGSRNSYLRQRLQQRLSPVAILTTEAANISVEHKEAIAFAVLAYWRWHNVASNLPKVTGATTAVSLGEVWNTN